MKALLLATLFVAGPAWAQESWGPAPPEEDLGLGASDVEGAEPSEAPPLEGAGADGDTDDEKANIDDDVRVGQSDAEEGAAEEPGGEAEGQSDAEAESDPAGQRDAEPGADAPPAGQPSVDPPSVDQPGVDQPGVDQPGVDPPKVSQPSAGPSHTLGPLQPTTPIEQKPWWPRPAPEPVTPSVSPQAERLLPPAPVQSVTSVLQWLALGLAFALLTRLADRPRDWLARRGLLPRLARMLASSGRVATLVSLSVAALYALPERFAAAMPYVLIGAAIAMGWTARDLLRDVLAGLLLTTEGRVTPGRRVHVEGHTGVVEDVGFRSVLIVDDDGVQLTVPNRLLLDHVMATDDDPYAPVGVQVHVSPGAGAGHVRQILEELVLLSPYVAPSRPPHVYRDPTAPDVWIVEARLVHPRYARSFRGALVELADEVLGHGTDDAVAHARMGREE